jgi:L-ornithine N5-oxygenase
VRRQLINYHRSTNYSAVDLPLIEDLYAREYAERVAGNRRMFLRGATSVLGTEEDDDGVRAQILHHPTGAIDEIDCDAVIYATGFLPAPLRGILGDLITEHTHGLTSSLLSNIAIRSAEILQSILQSTQANRLSPVRRALHSLGTLA